jgi:uncharacterized protein (TIGR00255 family)
MTAFGRAEHRTRKGRFSVEIQSLNRKYREIFISLPRIFSHFEPRVRKAIEDTLLRGKVSVNVSVELDPGSVNLVRPNVGLARSLLKSYRTLAEELGFNKEIDFSYIVRNREVIENVEELEKPEEFWPHLEKALQKAIREILKMKKTEGREIATDFRARLQNIAGSLSGIRKNARDAVGKYRKRLMERIRDVANHLENEEKILREVAIYADRTDITEEITRLRSHIKQFGAYMRSSDPVGRTLDFLVQEMHRETNTIGAKSSDLDIANSVVVIKSELEKIREQVQNVE